MIVQSGTQGRVATERMGADGIRDAKKDKEGVNGRCFGLGLSLLRLSNRHTVSSSFWSIFHRHTA